MFMDLNRDLNGADKPAKTAADDARDQAAQETLLPNTVDLSAVQQNRTFEPNLDTLEAINRRHYRGGLDDAEWPDYEDKIPVGPKM